LPFYTFVCKPSIVISTYNATTNISFYCLPLLTCKSWWICSLSCLCGDLQSQLHTVIHRSLLKQDGRKSECNSISFRCLSFMCITKLTDPWKQIWFCATLLWNYSRQVFYFDIEVPSLHFYLQMKNYQDLFPLTSFMLSSDKWYILSKQFEVRIWLVYYLFALNWSFNIIYIINAFVTFLTMQSLEQVTKVKILHQKYERMSLICICSSFKKRFRVFKFNTYYAFWNSLFFVTKFEWQSVKAA
jgi:hypothetical protein